MRVFRATRLKERQRTSGMNTKLALKDLIGGIAAVSRDARGIAPMRRWGKPPCRDPLESTRLVGAPCECRARHVGCLSYFCGWTQTWGNIPSRSFRFKTRSKSGVIFSAGDRSRRVLQDLMGVSVLILGPPNDNWAVEDLTKRGSALARATKVRAYDDRA